MAHPGGRPPKYKTHEDLQPKIDEYFSLQEEKKRTPTVAGLAHHLGFTDRQSVYDYKEKPEFACILKRAILFIESIHENNLTDGRNCVGSIFWLKNHKWRDSQSLTTIDTDGNDAPIALTVEIVGKKA